MPTKDQACKGKGCQNQIYRANLTGFCADCIKKQQREKTMAAAARAAAGRENQTDTLQREVRDLTTSLSSAQQIIKQHEQRGRFEDRLLAEVAGFIQRSPYRPQLKPYNPPKTVGRATEHEMLAVLSDAHYPEVVDPEQTFGIAYGPTIAKRRMEYWRDKVIRYGDLRRASYPVRKLIVGINGDMVSGDIHEELEVTNAEPITESVVKMAYILFDLLSSLKEHFGDVEAIVMPGNHPRVTKKPRFKQKWNNWEWVMGQFLKALAGKDFTVTVPKALVHQFSIFDQRIGISHGDGQKVQSYAGIPFYGMEKRRTKLQSLLKETGAPQLDLLVYGHFHQLIFEEGQGCSMLVNGSIKGGDEFTTGTNYGAQEPVQALLTFHPKHGITDLSRINLGHIKE